MRDALQPIGVPFGNRVGIGASCLFLSVFRLTTGLTVIRNNYQFGYN